MKLSVGVAHVAYNLKHSVSILDIGVDNLYVNLVNMIVMGGSL